MRRVWHATLWDIIMLSIIEVEFNEKIIFIITFDHLNPVAAQTPTGIITDA